MKEKILILILSLSILLLFVCGQVGCPSLPGEGEAKRTGLDFSLISGIDYLTGGKVIEQGETFYIGIKIENYDQKPKNGQVCIKDNIDDGFGGVSSEGNGECKLFNVKAAEIIKKETTGITGKKISEEIKPAVITIYFPETAEYNYNNLPLMLRAYEGKLFVSLRYRQISQATATVTVPGPEQPLLSQEPAPILVSVVKSIRKKQEAYKVDLDVLLRKQQVAKLTRIFSWDFSKENVTYFSAEMVPLTMSCTVAGKSITDIIEFENEKLVKCSTPVYLAEEVQQSYPLIITLDYGVALEKSYAFGIKTEEE